MMKKKTVSELSMHRVTKLLPQLVVAFCDKMWRGNDKVQLDLKEFALSVVEKYTEMQASPCKKNIFRTKARNDDLI